MAAAMMPSTVMSLPRRASFSCRGVEPLSVRESSRAMAPNCVASPTEVTIMEPKPEAMLVPEKSMLACSATGVSGSVRRACASFLAGTLSPVSADSSAVRSRLSTRRPSAGTRSPQASESRSPQTISDCGIMTACPSRTTLTCAFSLMAFSASKAFWLRSSITTVMTTESEMATNTPMTSKKSASRPVTRRKTLTASAMSPAAMSIKIMGSVAACQMRSHTGSASSLVKVLEPWARRISGTRLESRPRAASVENRFTTSCALDKKVCICPL